MPAEPEPEEKSSPPHSHFRRGKTCRIATIGGILLLFVAITTSYIAIQKTERIHQQLSKVNKVLLSLEAATIHISVWKNHLLREELLQSRESQSKAHEQTRKIAQHLQENKDLLINQEPSDTHLLQIIEVQQNEISDLLNLFESWESNQTHIDSRTLHGLQNRIESIQNNEEAHANRLKLKYRSTLNMAKGGTLTASIASIILFLITIIVHFREKKHHALYEEHLEKTVQERTKQLQKANLAKSEFLAVMSHEIRTPLNSIIGWSEILKDNLQDSKTHEEIDHICAAANTLDTLIGNILSFSKIEAREIEIELSPTNPKALLEEIQNACDSLRQLEIPLKIEACPTQTFLTDRKKLTHILLNLISNALKFTDKGSITITFSHNPQTKIGKFTIQDTGIGIPEELKEDIFKPFTQANSSTTRRHNGTGLGLAICKNLTEILGGTLRMESTLHEGTLFTVELPMETTQPTQETPQKNPTPYRPNSKILLAEDNKTNRQVAKLLLQKIGFKNCTEATNGEEAVKLAKKTPFDIILMDVEMPGMDGIQATKEIRNLEKEDPNRRPSHIIAVTAHALEHIIQACLQAGMDNTLTKPITKARLQEMLPLKTNP